MKRCSHTVFNAIPGMLRQFTCILLLMQAALVCAGELRFERVMTEGTASVAETNVVTQDHLGYIWIGGSNGLARYDGNEFKLFRYDPKDTFSISSNFVWDILVDSDGVVWVATTNGLNRFDQKTERFERFRHSKSAPGSLINNDVYRLFEDSDGEIWVGTRHGLDRFNRQTKDFFHFRNNSSDQGSISDDSITAFYGDSRGRLWVGTARGLNLYDPESNRFSLFEPNTPGAFDPYVSVRDIAEDKQGNFWVATDRGLYRFHLGSGSVKHFRSEPNAKNALGDNRIWKLLIDESEQLWVATDRGGLSRYRAESEDFVRYNHNPHDKTSLASNQVRDVFQDSAGDYWVALFPSGVDFSDSTSAQFDAFRYDPEKDHGISHDAILSIAKGPNNKVWVGTEGGLNLFDPHTHRFSHFVHQDGDIKSLSANAVLAITQDQQGNYWFGTWSGGLNKFNMETGEFDHFLPSEGDENSISSSYIWSLMTDSQGRIWIGTEAGALDVYDPETGEFSHFYPNESDPKALSGGFIRAILEDSDGAIWVATLNGLNKLDVGTNQFTHYKSQPFDNDSLPHNTVASLMEDSNGRLWVGTEGGLAVLDKTSNKFTVYTTQNGLPNNSIMGMGEDANGNLWIATLGGLSRFLPDAQRFHNYSSHNGLAGNIMNRPAIYYDPQGFVLAGSTRGLTKFNPDSVKINQFVPPVVLTDFKIFNRSVDVGENALLQNQVEFVDEVTLDYQKNMFSVSFAALNYRNSANNQYQYRMAGFDNQWISAEGQRSATYTNLSPGSYKFTVKGSNNSGVWNDDGKSLKITILPPPWRTWWAYFLYILMLVLLVYLFVRNQRRKVLFEQEKVRELRKLDRLKDEFLANTSHELRTPLNGIIGLSDSLVDDPSLNLSDSVQTSLKMISHSGKRLANLINDILDFSKIKNNSVDLQKHPTDFKALCEAVCMMLRPLAEKKGIRLEFDLPENLPTIMGDANRLEQVLYNLIGNAIKFTAEGTVNVSATSADEEVIVDVKDTGIGIPEADLESIFNSFTQAQGHAAREHEGTGLGLSVAKNLIELHGGAIKVSSVVDQGSTFSFNLPITDQPPAYPETFLTKPEIVRSVIESDSPDLEVLVTESPSSEHFKFHILVVDDDSVNRQVLIGQLSLHNYRITEAENGQEAVDRVRQDSSIDLVLLDVMMPKMTGYQAAKEIREIKPVHELPIIFITAKHLASDLVAGFMAGGNDFLIKPVSKNELLQRTKTHLLLLDVTRNLENIVEERTNTLKEARRTLESIDNIVNNINQQHNLQGLASVLLQESSALLDKTYAGAFWLLNENREAFQLVSTIGAQAKSIFPEKIQRERLASAKSGEPLNSGVYIAQSGNAPFVVEQGQRYENALVMAIETGEGLAGLLAYVKEANDTPFSDDDRDVMARLQTHAVSAVAKARLLETLKRQNLKLERLGYTDQLTGLCNRRHLIKYLQGDLALCRRRYDVAVRNGRLPDDADLLFILIDIDHFKIVNDTYGHNAGDSILRQFSDLMKHVFRESDHIIRWGGEEFLVVVRFVNRTSAAALVERFRQLVETTEFPIPDGTILHKTCSIGYSCYPFYTADPQAYTWEQVVEVADASLYAAKKSQRNAWLGVYGKPQAPAKVPFYELENNLQKAESSSCLSVTTSIPDTHPVVWK